MKKYKFLSIILSIVMLFSFSACSDNGAENGETNKYQVTFVYNNGQDNKSIYVEYADKINEPVNPQKESCVFIGWYTDASFENEYDFDKFVKKNITLYAKFENNANHSITYVYNNGWQDYTFTVKDGRTITFIPDPEKADHVFVGWYTDSSLNYKYDFSKPVYEDLTLYAKYNSEKTYTVTFIYYTGVTNKTVEVNEGEPVQTPEDKGKLNYIFIGWYTDSGFNYKYDFSKAVTKNLTLYSKYELDALTLTNQITTDTMKGIVKIYNKSYDFGNETSPTLGQGSGFCFYISNNGYYYVLTNCHVAKKKSGYDAQSFIIEDYQGNEYEGYLYKNSNKSYSAISADYDLACLYFKSSNTNVKKLDMAILNPSINDDVISLGAPDGQTNAITFGKISNYSKLTLTGTSTSYSNVTFEVIRHNAKVNNGSSGGPLLDAYYRVIGVNYAGQIIEEETAFGNGSAIPIEKVREFLTKYVYN